MAQMLHGGVRLPYADRREAGQVLADRLLDHYQGVPGLLVLALPRGGVPVAAEVARLLDAPLDVVIVRKLGLPGHPELAMGAIAPGAVRVMTELASQVPASELEQVVAAEQRELERREALYRGARAPVAVRDRTVLLVDDGLATGATMEAAARAVLAQSPRHLCIAVPVGARESCDRLRGLADRLVCPAQPEPFRAVGLWYRDFRETSDDEVLDLLAR